MTSGWEVRPECAQSAVVGERAYRRFAREDGQRPSFFFLRHDAPYTQEQIDKCGGRLRCFNCTRAIMERVWFAPIELTKQEEIVADPLPHCRKECALGTTVARNNNSDRVACFFMMYGPQVRCPPPRELLFLPGGCSIERYHAMIDENLVIDAHPCANVRAFVAPMYFSGAVFADNVITAQALETSKELLGEPPAVFAHSTHESAQHQPAISLPMRTELSAIHAMFAPDPMACNDFN